MSQKDFNKDMNSYFRSKNRSRLFENIKSRLSDIKSVQMDHVRVFSGNISKRMADLKDRFPKEKLSRMLKKQPGPAQEKQPSSMQETAVAASKTKSISDYIHDSKVLNKLKAIEVTKIASAFKKQMGRLKIPGRISKPGMAGSHPADAAVLQKEKELDKNNAELEKLKAKKEALEKDVIESQEWQKREKELIEKSRLEKEEEEIQKKIMLERQLKEKEERLKETEKEKNSIEKEKLENLRRKEKLNQEIKEMMDKKKIEEARLEEIRRFRKQEAKELGAKRFFMPSAPKQEDQQQLELERQKRIEELKLQKEKIRMQKELELQRRREEQNRKLEELKLQRELQKRRKEEAQRKRFEDFKRQRELKKQRKLEKRKREGLKLGFIHIKSAEQVEREKQEEERKRRLEEEKKAEEMQKMHEELAQKEQFFTNVNKKDDSEYVVHQEDTGKGSSYTIRAVKKNNDAIVLTGGLKK